MRVFSTTDTESIEKRKKQINEVAEEISRLIVSKKMSYADTREALDIARSNVEELTGPVFLNS